MKTLPLLASLAVALLALPARGAPDETKKTQPEAAKPQPWEFPREVSIAGRKVLLSEPTLLSRDDATGDVKFRFAASLLDGAGRIYWGVIDASGKSHLDMTSRLVVVDGIQSGAFAMPTLGEKERDEVSKAVPEALPKELLLRLEILTAAPGAAPAPDAPGPKISVSGPEIIVRRTPAVLVQIDGEPVKDTLGDLPMEYVANTSADLFREPKSDVWYLLLDGVWIEAKSLAGPWKPAASVPILLSQLPVTHPRGHVRQFIPGTQEFATRTGGKKPAPPAVLPEILVREKPAELVLLEGDPLFMMVPGVKLLVVANSASDILYHPKTAQFFLLVAGRWFVADDVTGPWKEVFGGLPEEFGKIPRDHVRGHVAWCVPGTPEAAEATALASMEERVTVTRATGVQVNFDDKEIRTVPVEGADLKIATNTDDDVFVSANTFWACVRGVWFTSDDGRANWQPSPQAPKTIGSVPEASAIVHTRFCRALGPVEGGFRYGVTGSYLGVFPWKGAPVHGAGHQRRGILRAANWYPYPRTWGENRWYDPIAGVFQPRSVRYDAEMKAMATEWSPYTAGYGRVQAYADRYGQGGRRMYTWTPDRGTFDLAAPRPDAYLSWGTQIKERDGLPASRFPLGDRSAETAPKESPVVADAAGTPWRLGEKGPETWKDGRWQEAQGIGAPEKQWLEIFARINARPAQLRSWAEKRRAPLPVNPTVTK
jgi:hypothetical protein